MNITVDKAALEQKEILHNLMNLYLYDLNEHRGEEIGDNGRYTYAYFETYWEENERQAYFIRIDGKLAGFVMINQFLRLPESEGGRAVAEFFVMRKYRRKGVATEVGTRLFELHKGNWELVCWDWNVGGQQFWNAFLSNYRGRHFRVTRVEEEQQAGWLYYFDNS